MNAPQAALFNNCMEQHSLARNDRADRFPNSNQRSILGQFCGHLEPFPLASYRIAG
jgi:hypothetical protein